MRLRLTLDLWFRVVFDALMMTAIAYWILPLCDGPGLHWAIVAAQVVAQFACFMCVISGVYSLYKFLGLSSNGRIGDSQSPDTGSTPVSPTKD